jgi:hypothetical protein
MRWHSTRFLGVPMFVGGQSEDQFGANPRIAVRYCFDQLLSYLGDASMPPIFPQNVQSQVKWLHRIIRLSYLFPIRLWNFSQVR